jgi:hypothetical protein
VRLIALGVFKGTPVADLRVGDTLVWNWGAKSHVVKIEPTKSGHSVILSTRSEDGADLPPQRKSLSTLLVLYACGAGCTADPEQPSQCVRCGRKLLKRPAAARELPIVQINGTRYYRDARLREHRAVDNPHDRLPY